MGLHGQFYKHKHHANVFWIASTTLIPMWLHLRSVECSFNYSANVLMCCCVTQFCFIHVYNKDRYRVLLLLVFQTEWNNAGSWTVNPFNGIWRMSIQNSSESFFTSQQNCMICVLPLWNKKASTIFLMSLLQWEFMFKIFLPIIHYLTYVFSMFGFFELWKKEFIWGKLIGRQHSEGWPQVACSKRSIRSSKTVIFLVR